MECTRNRTLGRLTSRVRARMKRDNRTSHRTILSCIAVRPEYFERYSIILGLVCSTLVGCTTPAPYDYVVGYGRPGGDSVFVYQQYRGLTGDHWAVVISPDWRANMEYDPRTDYFVDVSSTIFVRFQNDSLFVKTGRPFEEPDAPFPYVIQQTMLEDNLEYLSMFKSAHQLGWDAIPPPSHRRQLQQERK